MAGEYVYSAQGDRVRVKVFRRDDNGYGVSWDYDVWTRKDGQDPDVITFSQEAGDYFRTKADALADVKHRYGKLKSINHVGEMTEGWPAPSWAR